MGNQDEPGAAPDLGGRLEGQARPGGRPVDSVLVASGGSASEQISMALKLVKFGGHVACVSGFFGDDTVTIPLEVWNWGISDTS